MPFKIRFNFYVISSFTTHSFNPAYRASEITARARFYRFNILQIKLDRTIIELHNGDVHYDGNNGQVNDRI